MFITLANTKTNAMKKSNFISTFILSFLFILDLSAQISAGVQMGTHHSNTSFNGISEGVLPNNQALKDFTGSVFVDYALDQNLSVRSGLNFKQKGFIVSVNMPVELGGVDLPIGVRAENRINYIEVPLMLNYKIPALGIVRPYIGIGPSLAFAQSGYIRTTGTAIIDFTINKTELDLSSDTFRRTELVGNAVAGLEIPYGKGFFSMEAGFEKSLQDFMTDSFVVDTGARHRGISLKVGYGIRF